jgi:hypothetical protein
MQQRACRAMWALPPDVRKVSDLPRSWSQVLGLRPNFGRSPKDITGQF